MAFRRRSEIMATGPALAQEAIQQYRDGRLRSIMIVGHSLGGGAAVEMAAELGQAGVPVQLVVTLDPVGASQVSSNVRRSVNFHPTGGEDHFSVIAAHERDLSNYVLGSRGVTRRSGAAP
ncbi:lipase family protein [Bradyrhizobium erythrophlei]|uniref:lipase family protein n=1 Tax=Bradyrhizobium erythrophlei TaxID=1437360 RepID=UPI0012AB84D1|nr:lipase family protein [Bradyrhizobium erythrophlei]